MLLLNTLAALLAVAALVLLVHDIRDRRLLCELTRWEAAHRYLLRGILYLFVHFSVVLFIKAGR